MTGLSTGWSITRSASVESERHARRSVLASGPVSRISRGAPISGARDRLPVPQPLGDQLGATLVVAAVQDAQVFGIGAQVDPGGPRVDLRVSVRTSREVPGRAIGGFDPDLARAVQLRGVRVPGPLSVPVVEDAGGLLPLLGRFAPVSRGQGAI